MAVSKKIEMTDEIAAQLRGLLPISLDARKKIIPEILAKIPKKYQPTFTIRPMTKAEKQAFSKCEPSEFIAGDETVFACIESVENLWDIESKTLFPEFTKGIFDALHPAISSEIAVAILEMSSLTKAEAVGLK
jgi:hypothetical protein